MFSIRISSIVIVKIKL